MGIFDQIFGGNKAVSGPQAEATSDQQAIERYRYMLKTASPETLEQAHAEAFAQLTPEQRRSVIEQLRSEVPEAERAAALRDGASPQALSRLATRAEVRNPGTMERTFGRMGAPGLGGLMAGSFLGSIAGTVLGTMIAQQFLGAHAPFGAGAAEAQPQPENAPFDQSHSAGDSGDFDAGGSFDV